jgi:RNA polymerase sigma factor (sigma-70 family)
MADRLEVWFKSRVLIHEDLLMRFLARAWPNRDDLTDLRQEAYARVCEAAQHSPPQRPKAFLFAIARHIMSDRRRRERIVSIQAAGDHDFANDLVEEKTPERHVGANQELMRLAQAFDRLPARCREVIWMRRVLDLPQKEIATRLQIGEKAVEKQIVRGGRLIAHYLLQPASAEADNGTARREDDGSRDTKADEEST